MTYNMVVVSLVPNYHSITLFLIAMLCSFTIFVSVFIYIGPEKDPLGECSIKTFIYFIYYFKVTKDGIPQILNKANFIYPEIFLQFEGK